MAGFLSRSMAARGWVSEFLNFINFFSVFMHQLKPSQPNPNDLGYVDSVSVEEIGSVRVC